MPIFLIKLEAMPLPESTNFNDFGGAYVSCWLKASSKEEAYSTATAKVSESGWIVNALEEECCLVLPGDVLAGSADREHYEQALIDGECYIFHTWPNVDQEDADVN